MSDINLRTGLKPSTFHALETLCADRDWPDFHNYMPEEQLALLCFRLKYVEDTDEHFPCGKWATIQRLQQLVEDWAAEEVKNFVRAT